MKLHFIENNGYKIRCELIKRKNSRNIRMRIDNSGIVKVSLPFYTSYFIAKNFVNNNISWIENKLLSLSLRGNKYYYLGKNIRLIKINYTNIKNFNYILNEDFLIIEGNLNSDMSDEEHYFNWLRKKANEYIPNKVKEFSKKYNFDYNSVRIKNLNSRWGSCSSKKNLSFNLKLMYFNYKIIDYVLVHELCHLKEMNHSKKFWNLVEEIVPDYKNCKLDLNKPIHT